MVIPVLRKLARAKARFDAGQFKAAETALAPLCAVDRPASGALSLYARCAASRQDWAAAVERWRRLSALYPEKRAAALPGLARALGQTGDYDGAKAAWLAELDAAPNDARALANLASLAARRGEPAEALGWWRRAIAAAPDAPPHEWLLGLARSLAATGELDEALSTARATLTRFPALKPAQRLYGTLLHQLNRRALARHELATGVFAAIGDDASTAVQRMITLTWLEDLPAARAAMAAALAAPSDLSDLAMLVSHVPKLYDPPDQVAHWRALQARVPQLQATDPQPAAVLTLRLHLACGDLDLARDQCQLAASWPAPWGARFARLAVLLRQPPEEARLAPKVFGIGLSRTGTTSLHTALEQLGLLAGHFLNPFTTALLTSDDAPLLDAMSDITVSDDFETLYARYPNARFVWTQRDPAAWRASFKSHYEREHGSADFAVLRAACAVPSQMRYGAGLAGLHQRLYFRHPDVASAAAAYADRVEAFFADKPAGTLLRLNICEGQGWETLCPFLNLPIPAVPFPYKNKF